MKNHSLKYGGTTELSKALSGFNFRELLRDESVDAKKKLSRTFAERYGEKCTVLDAEDNRGSRVLKVSEEK